jgi:hypothetical protein
MNLSQLESTLMEDSWRLAVHDFKTITGYSPAEHTERKVHDAGTSASHIDNQFMEDGH